MSEHDEQVLLFDWATLNSRTVPCLKNLFAIPNGARTKTISHAASLKREGLRAGVPDIFLAVPVADYGGLFIEMKFGKNKTSREQEMWLKRLVEAGYRTEVCYGAENAIKTMLFYLSARYKFELKKTSGGAVPFTVLSCKERK